MSEIQDISPQKLQEWLQKPKQEQPFILDVRNNDELEKAKLLEAYHIPMNDILDRLNEIPQNKPIVCMCHHGMRSSRVAYLLCQKNYTQIYNLEGGIHAMSNLRTEIAKY